MKANLIEIRQKPKEWYDNDNEKYREIFEESDMAVDFSINNETFTVTLSKSTFSKLKNKDITIKLKDE